jgi:hypothetical protein
VLLQAQPLAQAHQQQPAAMSAKGRYLVRLEAH